MNQNLQQPSLKFWLLTSLLVHTLIGAILTHKYSSDLQEPPLSIDVSIHKPRLSIPIHGHKVGAGSGQLPSTPSEITQALAEVQREIDEPINAKVNVYTLYYERVKQSHFLDWRNEVAGIVQTKRLTRFYQTVLWVILRADGLVEQVLIVKPSVVPELDQAALRAFTGKFIPNPPKSLVDKDGKIRILWTFNVGAKL